MDLHEFENLKPEDQERIFHKTPFREKGELLMHAHNPGALTRSLSQEELYLVTRDLDTEERGEIIRYATLPQLFFLADIDCWKKDRIDGRSFLQWLETLLEAGDDQTFAWLMQMDYEAIVAGFQQVIQIAKPDHEWTADEALGDLPYFTIDQMYYIGVPEENMQTIKRSLEILFSRHQGRYFAVIEGVLGEFVDQVEEEAFHHREMRLGERGFPDFETARKIYSPLTQAELDHFPRKNKSTPGIPQELPVLPNYLLLWSQERFFLDDVLHSFQDDTTGTRDKLQEELAWISNKVIACSGIDLSSEEKVRRGIERARGLINIGLEALSGGDLQKAHKILKDYWLEIIFRWGVTQTVDLRDKAAVVVKRYWEGAQVDFLNFLDAPFDKIFIGLMRPLPQCYDAALTSTDSLRDFRALEDVHRLGRAVTQIDHIHAELTEGKLSKEFKKARKESLEIEPALTLYSFLGTLFTAWGFSKSIKFKPLEISTVPDFMAKAFEGVPERRVLRADLKESFMTEILPAQARALCLPLCALFFERLELEFRKFKNSEDFDEDLFPSVRFQKIKAVPQKAKRKS